LRSHFKRLCANSLEKLAGNFFELAGKQQGNILEAQGIPAAVESKDPQLECAASPKPPASHFPLLLLDESSVINDFDGSAGCERVQREPGWMSPQRFVRDRWDDLTDAS
jgi:hypothetical protein